jgi:transposase
MKCSKCGHEWKPRVPSPKRCPRCGKWLIPIPVPSPGQVGGSEAGAGGNPQAGQATATSPAPAVLSGEAKG